MKARLSLAVAILSLSSSTSVFAEPLSPVPAPNRSMRGGLPRQLDKPRQPASLAPRRTDTLIEQMQEYPAQNGHSNGNWGHSLADIARHLPLQPRYQDAYQRYTQAGDLVTAGHEWTHFINEHLSLQSRGASAYYVMDNKYITLADPECLRGKLPCVPTSLRGELYDLYLVENAANANVDPLYLLDEWVAYANDVRVAVDQLDAGKPLNPFNTRAIQTRTAGNVLEFTLYGVAVGMAVKAHDPAYYASQKGRKLRDFIAWNAQRSLRVHQKALRRSELSQGDARNAALLSNFRGAADTLAMRTWVKTDLSPAIADALLGVVGTSASGKRYTLQSAGALADGSHPELMLLLP